jgi:hypothetical protein
MIHIVGGFFLVAIANIIFFALVFMQPLQLFQNNYGPSK